MGRAFAIKRYILSAGILIWLIYAISYVLLSTKLGKSTIAGYLALLGESGLDFIAALLAFWVCKTSTNYKKIFFIFGLSFLTAGVADFIYNLILNINQIISFEVAIDSAWDIPFIIFLFLQGLAWFLLFFNNVEGTDLNRRLRFNFLVHSPYLLVGLIIFTSFTFAVSWKIDYFSVLGFYQIIDTLLEVLGFIFASFCLIRSNTIGIRYLSIGYLLVISSDLIIRYGVVTATYKPVNPLETTWVLGLLLVIIGFFFFCRHQITEKTF
jgi:hypothetical protein